MPRVERAFCPSASADRHDPGWHWVRRSSRAVLATARSSSATRRLASPWVEASAARGGRRGRGGGAQGRRGGAGAARAAGEVGEEPVRGLGIGAGDEETAAQVERLAEARVETLGAADAGLGRLELAALEERGGG